MSPPTTLDVDPPELGARPSRPGLVWLIRLRWLAVLGQLGATAVARAILGAELELAWILGLIGVLALTNVGLEVLQRRSGERLTERSGGLVLGILSLDTVLLTGLLLASGGPMNPFSVFYIVQVALAGLLLGVMGAWALAVSTSLAFGALFILTPEDPHAHHHGASPLHLQGMWVAYALAAGFVASFVSGIASALRRRERELARLRERALEGERLASLAAFSASAAHELGTPLSTIAVVATELATTLERAPVEGELKEQLVDDARLVRREVDRCRTLLRDLSERSGAWAGEAPEPLGLPQLAAMLREHLPIGHQDRLEIEGFSGGELTLPRRSLVESLANLVRNALAAAPGKVEVGCELDGGVARVTVRDRGPGFPEAVLTRLGQPFVTTGGGLGLGLHLARAFADKVGGRLTVKPRAGGGSEVTLELPRRVGGGDERRA